MEILFQSETDVTSDWLKYIELEARALSEESDLRIENYMDTEILNPQMQAFLSGYDLDDIADENTEPLVLNPQLMASAVATPQFFKFRKIKRKIRKIFCAMASELEGLSWTEIIQKLLIALIPAFAATGGVPAIVLPIVVGLVAAAMKKGYGALCPEQ